MNETKIDAFEHDGSGCSLCVKIQNLLDLYIKIGWLTFDRVLRNGNGEKIQT